VRLTATALIAGPIVLLLVSPWLAARLFDGRAPARIVATFHLLTLVGMAALPLVVLPCLALVRPGDLAALASPSVIHLAQTASRALALAYLLRLGWFAAAAARANSRLATSTALVAAEILPDASAGPAAHVLASPRPFAYTLGGRSGGVVVSRGMLGLLDDDERDAMLAHELAHLHLRHHRLLGFAQVVTAALMPVAPAVHQAAASLARELEVIADQAAAGAVGDRRVVARALAKAALAAASTPAPSITPAFGGAADLAYRLDRLTDDRPREDRHRLAAGAYGLLAAGLLAILGGTVQPAGLITGITVLGPTLLGIGWLYCRGVAPSISDPCSSSTLLRRCG
jgi:Zn-dependent protease with chaperone function